MGYALRTRRLVRFVVNCVGARRGGCCDCHSQLLKVTPLVLTPVRGYRSNKFYIVTANYSCNNLLSTTVFLISYLYIIVKWFDHLVPDFQEKLPY